MHVENEIRKAAKEKASIKVVVWDLDNTIWDGILLEDATVTLRPDIPRILRELDHSGILHSIASRNDHDLAVAKLEELGILEYFLYPQIHWNVKSASVRDIATAINIGLDSVAFIDDDPFERAEVTHGAPGVLVIDAADTASILHRPELQPRFITAESKLRRLMYQSDVARNKAQEKFQGPEEAFLASLGMVFRIRHAQEEDLRRAEELTLRTNQLNTTGYTYSYDELDAMRRSDRHLLLVASLEDRFGPYGTIGLAMVELGETRWIVKLLLMSCRVISRGVGTILLSHIMSLAKEAGAVLQAEFIPNGRNRMMYVTYRFGGFKEVAQDGDLVTFESDLSYTQPFPGYVQVELPAGPQAAAL